MLKYEIFFFIIVIFICRFFVIFINNNFKNFNNHIYYESKFIKFNNWSFVHLFSTILLQIIFKKNLKEMLFYVISWEIIENLIFGNSYSSNPLYFKEGLNDIFSDIIIAIPSFILSLI